jgi:uncharacterized protein YbbC (DUF1343 family)
MPFFGTRTIRRAGLLAAAVLGLAVSASATAAPPFELGIDVLLHHRLDLIQGRNVGLITNPTGVDRDLVSDIDLIAHAPGVHLVALFSPEHGIRGAEQAGAQVGPYRDTRTGTPVYSLYGKNREPTPQMLKGVDVLLFDIQPVGTRFYTYLYTMADAMKAAARAHIPFVVLDRPDPLGGVAVQGPVLEPAYASFVGQYPIALRYGMTVGELAELFNTEFHIGADLTIVKMRGWKRTMYYDDTPLQFVMPSPNMPTPTTALVYPGFGLFEGTNVSEGRGTTRPFELIGAPWIDAAKLADALNAKHLPGARFRPAHFTPTISKYEGTLCNGVQVHVLDRQTFNPVLAGLTTIETIRELYPKEFEFKKPHFDNLIGNDWVRQDIENDVPVGEMRARWQKQLSEFEQTRRKYLLYH